MENSSENMARSHTQKKSETNAGKMVWPEEKGGHLGGATRVKTKPVE